MEPYSLMFALEDGFSFVVFSKSHLYHPADFNIHNGMGLRIILKMGMCLIWNGSLVHAGAKSRKQKGKHMFDMRLFQYLWSKGNHALRSETRREDSFELHRKNTRMCPSFNRTNPLCEKCGSTTERCIDLSTVKMKEYKIGQIILRDIDMLGWIVVKGNILSKSVKRDKCHIARSSSNKWFKIDHSWRSQKFNSGYYQDEFLLLASFVTTEFLDSIKTLIMDEHLPNKNYMAGKTNLLSDLQLIDDD